MSRSSRSSRFDVWSESSTYVSKENKESSFLDQVLGFKDTIAHSLGFSISEEETEASSSVNTNEVEEDSRNDDSVSDEATLRYEMSKKSKAEKIETRVDPDDNYLQQNLRNIYKKKQEDGVSTKYSLATTAENDDSSLDSSLAESDDDSSVFTSNSFESEIRLRNYYTHSECASFEEKPPMSCRKPVPALKKSQKVNKKKSFHRKNNKSASVEVPVEEENKRVKWMDQIAADFDPYLFEMRREYAKNMCNVRLAMDEHNLIMEKIMKVNTIGLCGELAEM